MEDLSMLTKFEAANVRRLNASIKPTQNKIDKLRANLIAFTRKTTQEIESLEKDVEGFKTLKADIIGKYANTITAEYGLDGLDGMVSSVSEDQSTSENEVSPFSEEDLNSNPLPLV